ncbi:CDP-glucose 4,6-dehydratase [Sphingomonas sp. NFR04]|uniref:CDP-glucose 4,6-dehydratase n=1 Tax=Sphingomonas sp. NFR04 TaxID=1566283 RepID=UPI0008E8AD5D|nr:CDP-glucose 4,6-dehydratase [Sphingomonas sp. NFR04]SFJ04322.1 CDP-glucose 4,6-dehydratase [Sphingomonas sp. NFR04]
MGKLPLDESRLRQAFAGRRILLTGHSGFKGGWLALWLRRLGADITAVALPPIGDGRPSFFDAAGIETLVDHRVADIRDQAGFDAAVADCDPELVVHMAAQALVRQSYAEPVETFATNVTGTAIVLDAARRMPNLRGALIVTSDKCYDNREWVWGYREQDRLGGADPYSASKGCAEIVVDAYRRSFFHGANSPQIASVRAGNVFGGGDWSADRLIPDLIRAATSNAPVRIRNPASIRPWQHVLEPLAGYLMLGARILGGDPEAAGAWNFGPDADAVVDVETLVATFRRHWGPDLDIIFDQRNQHPPEAGILRLDSTKARVALGWRPRLSLDLALDLTAGWYRAFYAGSADMRAFSEAQIARYLSAAGDTLLSKTGLNKQVETASSCG